MLTTGYNQCTVHAFPIYLYTKVLVPAISQYILHSIVLTAFMYKSACTFIPNHCIINSETVYLYTETTY